MRCLVFLLGYLTVFTATAAAAESEPPRADTLSHVDALVLGLVEGISEFLPISSTGHLIIARSALGLDGTTPLLDAAGTPIWQHPPSAEYPEGVPLTLKQATASYIVVIQFGAIAAVALLYWRQLSGIFQGLAGRNRNGMLLLRNLLLAFFPVAIVGLTLDEWIDENLFSEATVIAALALGALLMIAAERWRRKNAPTGAATKEPYQLSVREALSIGGIQCLALWPGMSRSMVTMVGGYFAGLSPARSAEFSFLLGLPVLGGAAVYKAWKAGPAMLAAFGWTEMLLGGLVAAVSSALAIKFLISYLSRHGLGVFAVYRLVVAVVLALWFYT